MKAGNALVAALIVAIVASLGMAAGAAAAPQYQVTFTSDPETMPRNDEFLTYTAKVKNVGSEEPKAGDELKCVGPTPEKQWYPGGPNKPSFEIEWRRNGAPIPGAGGPWSGADKSAQFYVATAADEGQPIQCLITGTNAVASGVYASLPARVVAPTPPTPAPPPPPAPSDDEAIDSRPWVTDASGTYNSAHAKPVSTLRFCKPPGNWTSGTTFTYRWLRNTVPIPGATTDEYQPVAADDETNLQCEVTGTNAGGSVVSVSDRSAVSDSVGQPIEFDIPSNQLNGFNPSPLEVTVAPSTEPVVLSLELPPGEETQVFEVISASGWDCTIVQPTPLTRAGLICERPDQALPGASFPQVKVGVSIGADAPEPAIAEATVSGGGSVADSAEAVLNWEPAVPFGIKAFKVEALNDLGADEKRAGAHPVRALASLELTTKVRANGTRGGVEHARELTTELPAGFIGNPKAVPALCQTTTAAAVDTFAQPTCPRASIVGGITLETGAVVFTNLPIYAIEPERGAPAQFAFVLRSNNGAVYTLKPRLLPDKGYAISLDAPPLPKAPLFISADVELCGFGTEVKDGGVQLLGGPEFVRCLDDTEPDANPIPLLTNPTRCAGGPPVTTLRLDSWEHKGAVVERSYESPLIIDCPQVPFQPDLNLQPTSAQAESATGLNVDLSVPTAGLEDPTGIAQAHLKRTTVTLPKGMSLNPSAADGLAACTQAQLGMANGVPNDQPVRCPDASKVGTAVATTPILDEPLEGGVYLAKQGDNPFGTLAALYVVVESAERGVLIKLPGRVDILPGGQLISTFDNNPQAPVSSLELRFQSGNRAPLMTPSRCGSYEIVSELTPWSAADPNNPTPEETVRKTSSFTVTSGPGGGPCPTGAMAPTLKGGLANPVAGSSSPFVISLSRPDGSQRFDGLTMTLPKGLTATLKGVPYCSDAALASISGALGTGAAEIANPSCPAASQVGTVSAGAGAGSPYYVNTGKAYLAGPYKGAPLSLAVVVPAVAGPFDLGSVVVRNAIFVDPTTAQITVKSDPLPTELHNVPLDVRDIRVSVDRPNFTRAPTSCEAMALSAVVDGEEGGSAPASNPFQVGGCGSLKFSPKLKLEYKGQTKRTGNPALRAVLTQPAGQANISRTVVLLPKGSFIDNAHINNPCTRDQYAADACPPGSVLGKATAWSPLLDAPLTGKVYFRSNGGARKLPDVVASLRGQVNVELVGYVDAVENKKAGTSRVRNTFAIVPDAPVSKFVLSLKGGKVGLIENSKNLCKSKNVATVKMDAHNGGSYDTSPVVKTGCKKKKKQKKQQKSKSRR